MIVRRPQRGDFFRLAYGYDRGSNRSYAEDQVYNGASRVYVYDGLNRLTSDKEGLINSGKTDIESYWKTRSEGFTYDPAGNQLAVEVNGTASYVTNTPNKANEYTTRKVRGNQAKANRYDDFGNSATASHFSQPAGAGELALVRVSPTAAGTAPSITSRPAG